MPSFWTSSNIWITFQSLVYVTISSDPIINRGNDGSLQPTVGALYRCSRKPNATSPRLMPQRHLVVLLPLSVNVDISCGCQHRVKTVNTV